MKIDYAISILQKLKEEGTTDISLIVWTAEEVKTMASDAETEITDEQVDDLLYRIDDQGLSRTSELIDDLLCDLRTE